MNIQTRSSQKVIALAGAILLCCDLHFNCYASENTNTVSRNIVFENGSVVVHDTLIITDKYAVSDQLLGDLFDAGLSKKESLSENAKKLLQGENLEVQACKSHFNSPFLTISIDSKVVFPSSNKPARLNWLPTFGGTRPTLRGEVPKQDTSQLLAIAIDGEYLLLVPRLERHDENMKILKKGFGLTFDEYYAHGEPIKFISTLTHGLSKLDLLSWETQSKATNTLNPKAAAELDATYKMSGNDQLSLSTRLRIAKEGYYAISSDKGK